MSKAGRHGYPQYVLAILLAGYALNSFDRSILNLLLEPIRREFGATDTQLGLLSGTAFAFFFSALAIPIAALADRWNRRNLLVLCVLLWTVMTALCGLAGSFAALLMARAGVAIGQSGANPTAHSLIADYFPAATRSTALSFYSLGAPLGSMLAGLVGGWGSEHLGWRGSMLLAATPGLVILPLMFFTVSEPAHATGTTARAAAPPLATVIGFLWSRLSFRHLCAAGALHSAAMYCSSSFNPAYLSRSHGWSGEPIGHLVAMLGLTGLVGTFLGGFLADRLGARRSDTRWQLWIPAIATLAVIPVQLLCYLGSGWPMVVAFAFSSLLSLVYFGPSYGTVQLLAQPRMRAVSASMLMFTMTLFGMGTGPLLAGWVSDRLAPMAGDESLRLALLLVPAFNLWSGIHFFLAARHLREDLARSQPT